jgi:hypothetical protein
LAQFGFTVVLRHTWLFFQPSGLIVVRVARTRPGPRWKILSSSATLWFVKKNVVEGQTLTVRCLVYVRAEVAADGLSELQLLGL